MKSTLKIAMIVTAATASFAVIGCGGNGSSTPTSGGGTTAPNSSASLSDELGVEVPTQEEADATAAKEITAENADEAFKELEAEIEGGG